MGWDGYVERKMGWKTKRNLDYGMKWGGIRNGMERKMENGIGIDNETETIRTMERNMEWDGIWQGCATLAGSSGRTEGARHFARPPPAPDRGDG